MQLASTPLRALRAFAWLFVTVSVAGAGPAPKTEGLVHELPAMKVTGTITCSFGVGVVASFDRKTQSITHLYVDEVSPGSDAESLGLVRGDEILSINGRKVKDFKGGLKVGGDVFELLVNQPPGKKIDVEVAVRTVRRVSLIATSY